MRRLYYGNVMRATRYLPGATAVGIFHYKYFENTRLVKTYNSDTPEGIIDQLKADGVQVWGTYPLDYEFPQNAYEFWLWKKVFEADGKSVDEINEILEYESEADE